jgi:hypothetical protein
MRTPRLAAALIVVAALSACGDDASDDAPGGQPESPMGTGENDEVEGNEDVQGTTVQPGVEGSNLGNLEGQAPYNNSDD